MTRYPMMSGAVALVLALAACTPTPPPNNSSTATVTVTTTATVPSTPDAQPMVVTLYFGNSVLDPQVANCAQVYAVHRSVPAGNDLLTATIKELLAGPTGAEAAQGYTSWFSTATADALVNAKVVGDTSYLNFTDIRTIVPNASTSCGSAALLAQFTTTAQQAAMTPEVRFAINGQPEPFWNWLQMGCDASNDSCDPAPFAS